MSNDEQVQQPVAVEGNATSTLPPGMTQEEADDLVRRADERQARIDSGEINPEDEETI